MSAPTEAPGTVTLDWRHNRVNAQPKPCRICQRPALMTDETETPCHLTCAELEAARAQQRKAS